MTDIIELAFEAGAEVIATTKQDGFESPEYIETVWVFDKHQLTKFAQLLQQGEAVAQEKSNLELMMEVANKRPELKKLLNEARAVNSTPQVQQGEAVAYMWNDDKACYRIFGEIPKDKNITLLYTTLPDTQQKLDKAREALQFYADGKNISDKNGSLHIVDTGELAQQALKDTE